jgi:hypothetical protein
VGGRGGQEIVGLGHGACGACGCGGRVVAAVMTCYLFMCASVHACVCACVCVHVCVHVCVYVQGPSGLNGAWQVVKLVAQKRVAARGRATEDETWQQHD